MKVIYQVRYDGPYGTITLGTYSNRLAAYKHLKAVRDVYGNLGDAFDVYVSQFKVESKFDEKSY